MISKERSSQPKTPLTPRKQIPVIICQEVENGTKNSIEKSRLDIIQTNCKNGSLKLTGPSHQIPLTLTLGSLCRRSAKKHRVQNLLSILNNKSATSMHKTDREAEARNVAQESEGHCIKITPDNC